MNELVILKNNDIFTDSLIIANGTDNEHESIIKNISTYKDKFAYMGLVEFTDLKSGKRGRPIRICYLNEMQATFLITLLKNTDVVVNFKFELVKQFFAMRQLLFERQTKQWQLTRLQGKLTRQLETGIIKQLVEYAKEQGSKNSDKLYIVYTRLANKIVGINERDEASVLQLNNLTTVENIILHCIQEGIKEDKNYKKIYKDCKYKLEEFARISYLQEVI